MAGPLDSAQDTSTELQRLRDSACELQRELFARKSKQAGLATSLAHFTALARTLQLGLLFEDAARRITSINETFCALFGITEPDRLIGMDGRAVAELVHTLCADQAHFLSRIERAVTEQVPVTGEEIRLADGRWLERDYVPVMVDGTCVGHVWSYRDITERQQAEQVLNNLVEGTASVTGEAFFPALVQHLASALEVPFALVTELAGRSRTRLRALAMWKRDRLGRNFEYDTCGTPCEVVLAEGSAYYPTEVCALFPDDRDLVKLEADGYLGHALRDSQGEPIGHLCVITCTPFQIGARARPIMAVFAARASAELERKRADERLRQRLELEQLLAAISTNFISLGPGQVDDGINAALASIGRFLGADRSYVFLLSDDGATISNSHEWCADGITSQRDQLQHRPVEAVPRWMERLKRFEPISIPCVADLPDEAGAERAILQAHAIESLIAVPMTKGNQLVGFIGFDSVQAPRAWPEEDITLLCLLGEMVVNTRERERVEAALCASEEQLRSLYDDNPSMYFTVAPDGTVLSVNRFGAQQLGYQPNELIGRSVLALFHEDDKEAVRQGLAKAFADPTRLASLEFRKVMREGAVMWVRELVRVLPAAGTGPVALIVCEDITDRKRAEALLQAQKQVLELVASDAPLRDTLDKLVRLIEAQSDGMLGSILLLDEEGLHLRHGASPSLPDEYTGAVDGAAIGPLSGSCGTVAFRREPVIVEDIAADPLWEHWRDLALRHGLRACWSTPIVSKDALVLGTFAMYYREPRGPSLHDLQLIEHASRLAAIAIERQRAVQALRESEVRFREVTESIREVFWLTDPSKQAMLYVSPAYEEIWGRSCKSLYGSPQSWLDAIHGEDRNRVFHAAVTQQISGDYHEVYRIIRPDGSLRWIEDRAFPVKDASGTVVRVAGIAEDITARKRAEDEQSKRELLITLMLNTGPACIKRVAADGTLVHMNRAGLKLIEACSEQEVIGLSVFDLATADHRAAFIRMHQDVMNGQARTLQLEIQGLQGGRRWMETFAVPFRNSVSNCTEQLAVSHDITERKQVAEALRRSYEEHERISQDLHDDTLQSLYAVGLGLEATRQSFKRSSPAGATRVKGSIAQLNSVIHDVRSFITRMKTSAPPVGKECAEALRNLIGSFTATGGGTIELHLDSGLGVCCSAEQSAHVLAIAKEALSNSVWHARAAHRSVTLRRYRGGLRLEVAADGVWFRPSQQRGFGMGLTNMEARARRLGGRLRIHSKPGQGTRMVLYFLSTPPSCK